MTFLLGKPDYLIFNRRAVAGTDAFDFPGIHRRLIKIPTNDVMGFVCRGGDPTRNLFHVEHSACTSIQGEREIPFDPPLRIREAGRRFIAVLSLAFSEVDRSPIDPARSAGLKPAHFE